MRDVQEMVNLEFKIKKAEWEATLVVNGLNHDFPSIKIRNYLGLKTDSALTRPIFKVITWIIK